MRDHESLEVSILTSEQHLILITHEYDSFAGSFWFHAEDQKSEIASLLLEIVVDRILRDKIYSMDQLGNLVDEYVLYANGFYSNE